MSNYTRGIDREGNPNDAYPASENVNALVLISNTAQLIPIPASAQFVRMEGTVTFYAEFDGTPAVPAASTISGEAPIMFTEPRTLKTDTYDSIGVVAGANGTVTIEFFD